MKKITALVLTFLMIFTCFSQQLVAFAASNADTIYNFLTTEMGLNSAAACGVLANIEKESSFSPTASGDGGTSYGICQWHNSRYNNLKKWCSNNGYDYTSLTGQLYYLKYELNTSWYYENVLSRLQGVSNNAQGAYDAGYAWCYYFERPASKESKSVTRGNLAKNTYWVTYGSSSSVGTNTADSISTDIVKDRIYELYEILGAGSYFTTTHSAACGSKSRGHSCSNCKLSNIIAKTWFKNKFGTISLSQIPRTYYSGGVAHSSDGWSCYGFANFAEWYIFKNSSSDVVQTKYIGTYNSNQTNAKNYVQAGDIIRFGDSVGHSAIAISCDSTGINVLDNNWNGSNNCQVYTHKIKYTSYSTFTISRAVNSVNSGTSFNQSDSYSSTDPSDYSFPTRDLFYTSPVKTGSDVAWVQAVLFNLGYSISIDGSFGPRTKEVVKQFQSDYGLEIDGSVGPATRAKLKSIIDNKQVSAPKIHYWFSNSVMGESSTAYYVGEYLYLNYELYDAETGLPFDQIADKNYSVELELYDCNGSLTHECTYNNDSNYIGITRNQAGTYRGKIIVSGDYIYEGEISTQMLYDCTLESNSDNVSLNLNGTNSSTLIITPTGHYPGEKNATVYYNGSMVSLPNTRWSDGKIYITVNGLKAGETSVKIDLYEEYTGSKNVVATITIPINITANTYTISYNANGGSGAPASQQKVHGTDLVLSSTVPTGKTYTVTFNGNGGTVSTSSKTYTQSFVGWNTNSDGTGNKYQAGGIYSDNYSQTLYAKWENPKLSISDPTRSGYYFLGWYDSTSVDDYGLPLGKRYTSNTPVTGNVTLYAMWSQSQTVMYGDYNLDGTIDFITDALGFNDYRLGLIENDADPQEIYFRGDLDVDGDIDMDDVNLINDVRLGTLSYTNIPAYQKLYEVGICDYPTKRSYEYGENLDTTGLSMMAYYNNGTYYVFKNNLVVSGYDPNKIGTQTLTVNYYQYSDTFTVTVKAPQYSLYYNANGGSVSSAGKTVTYGSSIGALPTPEREGYTFLGWSYSETGSSYITSSTTYSYMSNKTVYAQWKLNTYTLTYNANGGAGAPSSQTRATSYTISSTVPTKFGYKFVGWSKSSSATYASYEPADSITLTSNTTLYAVWKSATIMSQDTSYSATVNFAGQENYYTFKPSTSGTYVIYSTADEDTKVYLYNSSGTELTSDDDGGEEYNFRLQYDLTAGTTYYFKVRYYNSSRTGAIPFSFGKVYTISYNANGGSGAPSSQSKDYGTDITLSSTAPTRTGYTFLGWSTSSTATSATYQPGDTFTTNANTTLYAVWKANTYTITFYTVGGTCSTANKTVTYDSTYGALPNPTKNGCIFDGWYTDSTGGTKITSSTKVTITANQALYAQWKGNTYSVTFDSCGGTCSTSSMNVVYNSLYGELPVPTRTGYSFDGWYTAIAGQGGTHISSSTMVYIAENHTLYAHWTANTYTVKYNANGGSGTMSNSNHTYNVSKALTTNTFTRSGYAFLGWATSSSATTATYTDGQSVKNLTTTNGGTVNLYAVWSDSSIPVVSISSTNNVAASQTVTLSLSDNVGVVSYYWGTNSSPSSSNFTSITSATSTTVTKTISSAATYYLIAKDVAGNVSNISSVTFYRTTLDGNSGSVSPSYIITKSGNTFTLPTATRDEYSLLGWSTGSSATTATYSSGSSYKPTSSTTLYAVWKSNTYTLAYNANGGSGAPSSQTGSTSYTVSSTVPTRLGYTFLGWATSSSATSAKYEPRDSISITSNTNLYAVWESATTLSTGTAHSATVNFANQEVYYVFTPSTSDEYTFESTGSVDSKVYVYDASGNELGYDDDSSAEGTNFKLTLDLTASTKYYVKVRAYSSYTGTISFKATTQYTVSYNANGGSGVPSDQTKVYGITLTLSTTKPEKAGYTFVGWNTAADGSGTSYAAGASYTANAAVTLYAQWEASKYTITFNANGGSCNTESKAVTYASTYGTLPTPTRTGYIFNGWYTASSGGTKVTSSSTVSITADQTLYAQWTEIVLSSISLKTNPSVVNYYVGDTLNTSGLTLTAKYSDGTTKTISNEFTCTPATLNTAGTQKITVTYGGKTTSFNVTVENVVLSSIAVKTMPTNTTYYVGDSFDASGLTLIANYNNGTTKTISSDFTCTPTELDTAGTQEITITYGDKTTSFNITVEDVTLSDIAIKSEPTKTNYYVGEMLSTEGLTLTATYNNGTTKTINSGFTCTPEMFTTAGEQEVTVTYGEKTTSFNVTVTAVTVSGISIKTTPSKMSYFIGDTLDTTGLTLTATYNNGTTKTISSGFTCTPETLNTAGSQEITVAYSGKTTTFDVNVESIALSSIAVKTNPTKTSYYVGDTLNTSGLTLTATYNNGTTKTISSGFTCTPTTLDTTGTQKITVVYGEKAAEFTVNVTVVSVSSVAVKTMPLNTEYFVGDTLSTEGLTLTVTYNNGKTETVSSGFTCTPTKLNTAGTQEIIVTYDDKSTSFNVDVKAVEISGISIASVPETLNYFVGDTLSTEGLAILVTYNNGTTKIVTSGFTCTPTVLETEGTQKITVAYGDKTASFNISVASVRVTELEIVTVPEKTSYKVGDKFDPTGLTMNAVNNKGEEIVVSEGFVCTPEILDKAGTQVVTVSYGGKSVMITVIVAEAEPETYVVKFVSNGEVISETAYAEGEIIVEPKVSEMIGYTFTGWTPQIPDAMPADNLTFTAIWKANSYDAIFDANGGSWADGATEKAVSTEYGADIIAPEAPARDGYVFSGWAPEIGVMDDINSKTFTAIWIATTDTKYTVEIYTMNTSGEYEKTSQTFSGATGDSVEAKYTVPAGFTLNAEKSSLEGTIAADNSLVLKVYIDRHTYTFTTVVDGVSTPTAYLYGSMVSEPVTPSKTDYKFIKWNGTIPETMPAENVTIIAVFEKCYVCPDCGNEILGEDAINAHIAAENAAKIKTTVKIKNNPGTKTIKYGETLRLTVITTDMPANAKIYWYVDGVKKGEGTTFEVSPSSGNVEITVKVVDANGKVLVNTNGNEVSDSQKVSVNSSFWQKIVSFFKNLFGMNRTVVQAFKGVF